MEDKFGEFGPIYPHFKGKAKDAIKWLRKTKQGECPMSLYRSGVGYIDIVWGENDVIGNLKCSKFGNKSTVFQEYKYPSLW